MLKKDESLYFLNYVYNAYSRKWTQEYKYIYIYIIIVQTNGKAIIGIATGHKKHEQGKMKLQAKECREQEIADA